MNTDGWDILVKSLTWEPTQNSIRVPIFHTGFKCNILHMVFKQILLSRNDLT